jgi:hypothetical protein
MFTFWPFHRHQFVADQAKVVLDSTVFEQIIPQYQPVRIWTCHECDGNVCQVGQDQHPDGKWARKTEEAGVLVQRVEQQTVQRIAECSCGATRPVGVPFSRRVPVKEAA